MITVQNIITASIIFWLLPPIRQFRKNYFYYFFILALSDPLNILYVKFIGTPLYLVHSIASVLSFYAVIFESDKSTQNIVTALLLLCFYVVGMVFIKNLLVIVLVFNFFVLLKFIQSALFSLYFDKIINVFITALLFYELIVVTNLVTILGGGEIKITVFFISLSFQILLAIFFTIFTDKSPALNIQLRSEPQ